MFEKLQQNIEKKQRNKVEVASFGNSASSSTTIVPHGAPLFTAVNSQETTYQAQNSTPHASNTASVLSPSANQDDDDDDEPIAMRINTPHEMQSQPTYLALQRLREPLARFYEEQAVLRYLFYDVISMPISQAPRLALVLEREQKEKECGYVSQENDRHERASDGWQEDQRVRSYEDIYGSKKPLVLEKLFEKQDTHDVAATQIIILGRAGIGKTTLCQFIAWQWSQGKLWRERYDIVFWLPLRNLLSQYYANKTSISIAEFIYRECYGSADNASSTLSLADIEALLREASAQERVLLLLDGYDEIAHADKKDTAIGDLLQRLLSRKHVIITSRPYAIPDKCRQLYKRLENMGFLNEDIDDYVNKFFTAISAPHLANDLLMYLKQNPLVWGTAHIPINLELICSAWHEAHSHGRSLASQLSMTELYSELVFKLSKRYLLKREHHPVTEDVLATLTRQEVLVECQAVLSFLGELAFEVSQQMDNRILIDNELINKLRETYKNLHPSLLLDDILQAHFLKNTGNQRHVAEQSFYFVHLTFQDYFAAYHIAERFKRGDAEIIKFIEMHKYAQRWEVVWWFVAGLLAEDAEAKERFFSVLDAPPRDLLGLYHLLLVMRCMDEVKLKVEEERKQVFLNMLWRWVALGKLILSLTLDVCCLQILGRYLGLSAAVFNEPAFVAQLTKSLTNKHPDILLRKLSTMDALSAQTTLPAPLIRALLALLRDPDIYTRHDALDALGRQVFLLPEVLAALVTLLRDDDVRMRELAARTLGKQPSLPVEIVKLLVGLLSDIDKGVRCAVAEVLGAQSSLSLEIINVLVDLLRETKSGVGSAAALALEKQAFLPLSTLIALVSFLRDEDWGVQSQAANALGGHVYLPVDVVNALAALLQSTDKSVVVAAAMALRQQTSLSADVLTALLGLLPDADSYVRTLAAKALACQKAIQSGDVHVLLDFLRDEQLDLSHKPLCTIDPLLHIGRLFPVREEQASLPKDVLATSESLMLAQGKRVRSSAIKVLGQQTSLPAEIVNLLLDMLRNKNFGVRDSAWRVLSQRCLPLKVLTVLVAFLCDEQKDVRSSAQTVLSRQAALPVEIVKEVVNLLGEEDPFLDGRLTAILVNQSLKDLLAIIGSDPTKRSARFFLKILISKSIKDKFAIYPDNARSVLVLGDEENFIRFASESELTVFIRALKEFCDRYIQFEFPVGVSLGFWTSTLNDDDDILEEANDNRLKQVAQSVPQSPSKPTLPPIESPEFIGPNIFELVKAPDTVSSQQKVAQIKCKYPTVGLPFKPIEVEVSIEGCRISLHVLSSAPYEPLTNAPVIFYVPGTGSQVRNPEINIMIASHLHFAAKERTQVVIINHRLCPEVFWPKPLTDTVALMKHFIERYKPSSLAIAGYSSGGLIAMLATKELYAENYFVENLILQAPESDLTREFRHMSPQVATAEHRAFLPRCYQSQFDEIEQAKEAAKKDTLLKESGFNYYVREMFPTQPRPELRELRRHSLLWRFNDLKPALQKTHVVIITGGNDYFLPENKILFALLREAGIHASLVTLVGQSHDVFWQRLFSLYACLAVVQAADNSSGVAQPVSSSASSSSSATAADEQIVNERAIHDFSFDENEIQDHFAKASVSEGETYRAKTNKQCRDLRERVFVFFKERRNNSVVINPVPGFSVTAKK